MYSDSSSDDEELVDNRTSKSFLVLQESYLWKYQVHPVNVGRNNFGEYHHMYKLRN
jgi:hypothetical protein